MELYKSVRNNKVMSKNGWLSGIEGVFSADAGVPRPVDLWDRVVKLLQLEKIDE